MCLLVSHVIIYREFSILSLLSLSILSCYDNEKYTLKYIIVLAEMEILRKWGTDRRRYADQLIISNK